MLVNEALKTIRVFHDMTQKELAESLGMSKSHLSEIESGKKTPTLAVIERYAKYFQIPASSILFFAENFNKDIETDKLKGYIASKILALMNFIAQRSASQATKSET
ncbi:MAG: helix-turn-helix transcriptional regulator [Spirulina sp. SIO3F2]|nr:helix-turn-helix transcriptional regulator [Spirulina sp. SIO3F2]